MADDLLTLEEYHALSGIDPTYVLNDTKIAALLPLASQAVRDYAERDFGSPSVVEERIFEYDGSGFLDIDDATNIASVAATFTNSPDITLDPDWWTAKPARRDDSPVFYYLELFGYGGAFASSPAMGFKNNLDVYASDRGWQPYSTRMKVVATWGWPDVPGSVKMATLWTIQEWMDRPSGEGLTSEAIEGWSRAWGAKQGGAALAIPGRARDLLAAFSKETV